MRWLVRARGEGRVSAPAYGLADAEHLVEKEMGRLFPCGRVEIVEVARPRASTRIVEEFTVAYRIAVELEVDGADAAEARRAAFRLARSHLEGSRYRMTAWSAPTPPARTK